MWPPLSNPNTHLESEKAVWSSTVSQMGVNLPHKKTLDNVWKHLFIFMTQAWVFCWHLRGKDHELLNNLQHTRKPPLQRVIQFNRSIVLRLRNTIEQKQLYASTGLKKTTLIYNSRYILHSSMFPTPPPKTLISCWHIYLIKVYLCLWVLRFLILYVNSVTVFLNLVYSL